MNPSISMIKDGRSVETQESRAEAVMGAVVNGRWIQQVERVRSVFAEAEAAGRSGKEAVGRLKLGLPGIMWSGLFTTRAADVALSEKLTAHSGLLCADLDNLTEEQIGVCREKLSVDPHVWAFFLSPTGTGLKVVVRVPSTAKEHQASFRAVQTLVRGICGVEIDEACKDVPRLCFASHDPHAFVNRNAIELRVGHQVESPLASKRVSNADLSGRQRIAGELLGPVEWTGEMRGLCQCPGLARHTGNDAKRDCEVHLDGAPTVHCFHNSCSSVVEAMNRELRSRIGREEAAQESVCLGSPSGGLCAIDFDSDEDLAAFEAVNPKLANTTQTRGARGGMIWVQIAGAYPQSCKSAQNQFEWRADRRLSTIHGRHPKGTDYTVVCDSPPLELSFDEIVWPTLWELPWEHAVEDKLRLEFGDPYYLNDKKIVTSVNESWWAGKYQAEHEILFEPDEQMFYSYNPATGLYEVKSVDSIRSEISSEMLEVSRQADAFSLQKKRTASTINNIITHLRGIVEQRGAFRDRREMIHLANGVIVFRDGEPDLVPFSPEFRSRNRSPIAFDESAQCERFLTELVYPAVHSDDVSLLQKFAGMFLLGHNPAQRILILDGEAGRGKTQLANVLQELVGISNVTQLRTRQLTERFELFRYLKKTLLVGVDVEPDFLSAKGAAVLKGLVGGDWFDAEQKGGTGSFPIKGEFNVVITSNARLRVRLHGDTGAWRRRLNIIRYEAPPPKRKIPDFGAHLIETEGSGILNWALQGAQMVSTDIAEGCGDLAMTDYQKDIVDSLLAESDSLHHFLRDRVVADERGDLTVSELVEEYAAYCPGRNWQPLPITEVQNKLEGLMLELFGVTKRHDIKRNDKRQRGFGRVRFQ
jgi:phage/plasmid-associated DNA primase